MKYYKTNDDDVNEALFRKTGQRTPVFTIMDYAKAFNVTRSVASRRILANEHINEISQERAQELGVAPPARRNGLKYHFNGENLTQHQLSVKYNVPASTIRKWAQMDTLESELLLITANGYRQDVHVAGPSASVWKVSSNGTPEYIDTSYYTYTIDLEYADEYYTEEAKQIYEESKRGLEKFYNTLKNVFNHHIQSGKGLMRQVKLEFVASPAHNQRFQKNPELLLNAEVENLRLMDQMNVQYRMMNCVKVDNNGVVHFISLPEFERRVASYTYNPERVGSDPESSQSLLADYRLNPGMFLAICEMSTIGRANNTQMIRNLRGKSFKHPYYVLMDAAKPISKTSCFFDAMKIQFQNTKQKLPGVWDEAIKKYSKGVSLSELNCVANVLGTHIKLFGNPINLQENIIGFYGPPLEHSEYLTSFDIYFQEEPEPHYSALIGVREKIYSCLECLKLFSTVREQERHKCEAVGNNPKKDVKINRNPVNVFYDVETVTNLEKQDVEVYSISFKWGDRDNITTYVESEFEKNPLKKFCSDLEKRASEENLSIKLIAFNGSSFDVWSLIKTIKDYIVVTDTLIKDNRFYSFKAKFKSNPKSILNVWDPFLYFRNSLENVSKSFGLDLKKSEFNHVYIQKLYNKQMLETPQNPFGFIQGELRTKIIEYNEQDVRILEQIVGKMQEQIPGCLTKTTASSYAYSAWQKTFDQKQVESPVDEEDYTFIRSAVVGGRVHTLHKFKKIEGNFVLIDVVSLYPSQMYNNWFPIGPSEDVLHEHPEYLGIYECNILFQKEPCIVPLKDQKSGKLNWGYCGSQTVVLSSVIIDLLRQTYGENCVKVGQGKIWRQKSKDVFKDFIDHWIKVKMQQDVYKNTDDPRYNPVLRETAKLMLNSLYGKTTQRVNTTKTVVSTSAEQTRILKKDFKPNHYDYEFIMGGLEIITGEVANPDYSCSKPQQLGVFILDYTKRKMYTEIFSKCEVFYSDTDSALVRKEDFDRLVSEGHIRVGKQLGDYDVEMDNIEQIYLIAPKCYALVSGENIKMRLKGVSVKSSGWCNTKTKESFDKIDIKCYDQLVEDNTKVKFFCNQLVHRKSGMTMFFREIEKVLN